MQTSQLFITHNSKLIIHNFCNSSSRSRDLGELPVIRCQKMFRDKFMAETLTGQTPLFGGSTGGLLTKAEVEEKYAITWTSPKAQVFEMPTGGVATMQEGDNLLYLARKEQCIALGAQFRNKFKPKIDNYKICFPKRRDSISAS